MPNILRTLRPLLHRGFATQRATTVKPTHHPLGSAAQDLADRYCQILDVPTAKGHVDVASLVPRTLVQPWDLHTLELPPELSNVVWDPKAPPHRTSAPVAAAFFWGSHMNQAGWRGRQFVHREPCGHFGDWVKKYAPTS